MTITVELFDEPVDGLRGVAVLKHGAKLRVIGRALIYTDRAPSLSFVLPSGFLSPDAAESLAAAYTSFAQAMKEYA